MELEKGNKSLQVYQNLTETKEPNAETKKKWTTSLLLCCLICSIASFLLGFNLTSLNNVKPFIVQFYEGNYFPEYTTEKNNITDLVDELNNITKKHELDMGEFQNKSDEIKKEEETYYFRVNEIREKYKIFDEPLFPKAKQKIDDKKEILKNLKESLTNTNETMIKMLQKLNKLKQNILEQKYHVEFVCNVLWLVTNCLFVLGGIVGSLLSKQLLDKFGRKNSFLIHYLFTIIGSILIVIVPYINVQAFPSILIKLSRFLFGIQGGMSVSLVHIYLNEISPASIRGQTSLVSQLLLAFGIFVSQILGLDFVLGNKYAWNFLLSIPFLISIIGAALMLICIESPKTLLLERKNENEAHKALSKLRNSQNVTGELRVIYKEELDLQSRKFKTLSLMEFGTSSDCRPQFIIGIVLNIVQQFSGILVILFYIRLNLSTDDYWIEKIKYIYLLIGLVNLIVTVIVMQLIDKIGRKKLIIVSILSMIIDLILMTIFLNLKEKSLTISYLSLVCLIIYTVCFSIGLGSIPFIFVAEAFKQDARTAAMAFSLFFNGLSALILTLVFPLLHQVLHAYVFIIIIIILILSLIYVILKLPETNGKTFDEIRDDFDNY